MMWEYMVTYIDSSDVEEDLSPTVAETLNNLGSQGWELIHIYDNVGVYYFKRSKPA